MAWQLSTKAQVALTESHKVAIGMAFFEPDGTFHSNWTMEGNVIHSGRVRLDRQSLVRRRASIRIVVEDHPELRDALVNVSQLAPYGAYCQLARGIQHVGYSFHPELVPIGEFEIMDVTFEDAGSRRDVALELEDRSGSIQARRLVLPLEVPNGTNIVTAILMLLQAAYGVTVGTDLPFEYYFTPTDFTTPKAVYEEDTNPWQAAVDLATAAGMDLYFTNLGGLRMDFEPDPNTAPIVWQYANNASNTVLEYRRQLTQRDTYNHIIVTGESVNGNPVRGEIADHDPSSPTYVGGPFGRRPLFHQSSLITTATQAQTVAETLFHRHAGLQEMLILQAVPNPMFDSGDVVLVQRPEATIDAKYVVDSVTIPLEGEHSMTFVARRRGL